MNLKIYYLNIFVLFCFSLVQILVYFSTNLVLKCFITFFFSSKIKFVGGVGRYSPTKSQLWIAFLRKERAL